MNWAHILLSTSCIWKRGIKLVKDLTWVLCVFIAMLVLHFNVEVNSCVIYHSMNRHKKAHLTTSKNRDKNIMFLWFKEWGGHGLWDCNISKEHTHQSQGRQLLISTQALNWWNLWYVGTKKNCFQSCTKDTWQFYITNYFHKTPDSIPEMKSHILFCS